MTRSIGVSTGAKEYVTGLLTEITGKNITTSPVKVGFAPTTQTLPPTTWYTPDVLANPTTSQVQASLLIGSTYTPPPGSYYLWMQLTDGGEIMQRVIPSLVVIT